MLSRQLVKLNSTGSRSFALCATDEMFRMEGVSTRPAKEAVINSSSLSNGVRIVTRQADTPIASFKFALATGSQSEKITEKGAAHLLAAAAYAGTGSKSALALQRSFQDLGCELNSCADRHKIVFDCKTRAEYADDAIALMMETIFSAPVNEMALAEHLHTVAKARYEKYGDDCGAQMVELVHEAAFGEGTPLGSSVYASCLEKVDLSAVASFRARTYLASNLVVAASGPAHEQVSKAVDAVHLPPGDSFLLGTKEGAFVGGEVRVRSDCYGGATAATVAFPVPATAKEQAVFAVISRLLNNRLASDKTVTSFASPNLFGFTATGAATDIEKSLRSVVAELKAACADAEAVAATVKQMSLENFSTLEGVNGTSVLLNSTLANSKVPDFAALFGVTAADVKTAVSAISATAKPAYAVKGTTLGAPSFQVVCDLMK